MKKSNQKIFMDYNSPIKTGEKMKIKLRLSNDLGFANDLKVMFNRHGEVPGGETKCYLMYNDKLSTYESSTFEGEIVFNTPGYRTFYIEVKLNGMLRKIEYDKESEKFALVEEKELNYFEQFVYWEFFETPYWAKGAIVYQVLVDTFCYEDIPEHLREKVVAWNTYPKWKPDEDGEYRNNQWYGGNLKGIIKRLQYIKSLGVTILYLTPILKSPSSSRYDVEDYDQIDEMVGTYEDLNVLKENAHRVGIYLLQDHVFNHSSNRNPLIKEHPDMYTSECWWGYRHMRVFDESSRKYINYFGTRVPVYLKYEDGFRIDVADSMLDYTLKSLYKIVKSCNAYAYFLLEVWKDAVRGDFREFLYGDEADGVMNYKFGNAILRYIRWGNAKDFKEEISDVCKLYPPEALDVSPIFISSHDTPRLPNTLVGDFMKENRSFENIFDIDKESCWFDGDTFNTLRFRTWEYEHDRIPEEKKELARKLHKLAVFVQYTLPGLPSIFAGDEVGAEGYKDPFNRKPFPWDDMDNDLYKFYVRMGKFRMQHREVFSDSTNFKFLHLDSSVAIYQRKNLIFFVNRSSKATLIEEWDLKKPIITINSSAEVEENILPAHSAVAIKF